jgi:hypothetical protein
MSVKGIENRSDGGLQLSHPIYEGGTVSDLSAGAYASDPSAPDDTSKAKQVTGQSKEAVTQAAADVKDTATEQAQRVGTEARTQARNVAADVRDKVSEQARTQNDKMVSTIRQTAGQLDEMRGDRQDSPAAAVVSRVADGGRQLADYLDRNGPEGVLQEVQGFARRRPGTFLATALVAGFVVGRLGKGVAKADPNAASGKPTGDSFASAGDVPPTGNGYAPTPDYPPAPAVYTEPPLVEPGYPSSTEYAATGTGTPVAVEDPYAYQEPRP